MNGLLAGSQTIVAKPTDSYPVRIGAGLTYTTAGDIFSGTIDEAAIYWRALTAGEVALHYGAGKFGLSTSPAITADPVSATRCAGGPFSLTIGAQGSYPLAYQWRKNGVSLSAATAATLSFAALQAAGAGSYTVTVSNAAGSTNSAAAALTVVPLPTTGYKSVIMADAPAAYFPLDDTNFTYIATEPYNFGAYDGIYQNGSTLERPGATAQTGYSVEFDGVSQSVLFGNPTGLSFTGQISLEAWVKAATNYAGGGIGNLIARGYSAAPVAETLLRITAGQYQVGAYDGANRIVAYNVPAGDVGNWVQLVGTYDGVAWNLYRNGALVARATNAVGALRVDGDRAIAARGTGTERFFQGRLDEVAIYPAALSPAQVAKHFFAATGQAGTLGIARSGANVVLTWNAGLLEAADELGRAWTPLPTAMSPLAVPANAREEILPAALVTGWLTRAQGLRPDRAEAPGRRGATCGGPWRSAAVCFGPAAAMLLWRSFAVYSG